MYTNAEVEPFVAIDPRDANHLVAVWQQDRWSNGGSRAVASAVSSDGGASWTRALLPMSRCGGALAGSAADQQRATDPWVDIGSDGVVHVMALAFSGAALQPGSRSAMLASRSTDGGISFSPPVALIDDGPTAFNDKNALTVDAVDPNFVYATWDRLVAGGRGPAMLARSTDGGQTWEPARAVFDPALGGAVSQTLGNRIVVVGNGAFRGTLLLVFTQIDTVAGASSASVRVVRSLGRGQTWGAPITVSALQAVGARDPTTNAAIRDGALLPGVATGAGGAVWIAWQDARFSAGARDAIALSRSLDGGQSWSAPLAANRESGVPAFTPSLAMRADGRLGLTHYDLRPDTGDAATLYAAAWLVTTADGVSFDETSVWSRFDLAQAPNAGGLFLGDYQGLVARGSAFLPLLVLSSTDAANRTDVYSFEIVPTVAQAVSADVWHARAAPQAAESDAARHAFAARRHEAIVRTMERRLPGWAARAGARPAP